MRISCRHGRTGVKRQRASPRGEIGRSVDYDEHCTVLVAIEDLQKCVFFALKLTYPSATKHNDAFGCVEKLLSVNGYKPLDPLNPENSFLGNTHVEFCPRSQIEILKIRGTIFWVVRHSANHVPRLWVRSSTSQNAYFLH